MKQILQKQNIDFIEYSIIRSSNIIKNFYLASTFAVFVLSLFYRPVYFAYLYFSLLIFFISELIGGCLTVKNKKVKASPRPNKYHLYIYPHTRETLTGNLTAVITCFILLIILHYRMPYLAEPSEWQLYTPALLLASGCLLYLILIVYNYTKLYHKYNVHYLNRKIVNQNEIKNSLSDINMFDDDSK